MTGPRAIVDLRSDNPGCVVAVGTRCGSTYFRDVLEAADENGRRINVVVESLPDWCPAPRLVERVVEPMGTLWVVDTLRFDVGPTVGRLVRRAAANLFADAMVVDGMTE